ncbi:unnamed protein product [Moneuplotes crassus]|uniref:Uncharacterized protein n=1 Tax=Euplotes crassus TaxID=5936 RepID=A0AAD1U2X9_EUPCR|nr:unnamed protein product [Moneuplotes crassus]
MLAFHQISHESYKTIRHSESDHAIADENAYEHVESTPASRINRRKDKTESKLNSDFFLKPSLPPKRVRFRKNTFDESAFNRLHSHKNKNEYNSYSEASSQENDNTKENFIREFNINELPKKENLDELSEHNTISDNFRGDVKEALLTKDINSLKNLVGLSQTPYAKYLQNEGRTKRVKMNKFTIAVENDRRAISSSNYTRKKLNRGYQIFLKQQVPNKSQASSNKESLERANSYTSSVRMNGKYVRELSKIHDDSVNSHLSKLRFDKGIYSIPKQPEFRTTNTWFGSPS